MKMLKIFQAVRNVRFPRVWIKMLIVGFDFFFTVSSSFVALGIGDCAFMCQVKDASNSTGFNFHFWFSKINVRRC